MAVAKLAYDQLDTGDQVRLFKLLKNHPHYERFLAASRPADVNEAEWVVMRSSWWSDWIRPRRKDNRPDATRYHRGEDHYVNIPLIEPADEQFFAGKTLVNPDLPNILTALKSRCNDIHTKTATSCPYSEQGLLGLMFDPNYETNGRFYVDYTNTSGDTVIEKAFPLLGPNGVGLAPDGRRVYVAETFTGRLWGWDLAAAGEIRPASGSLTVRHGGVCVVATPFSFDSLAVEADGRVAIGAIADGIAVVTPDGSEVDVFPIAGDTTTNIAFGGNDMRRAVITLSRSGRVVETTWPRPGLPLNIAH